MLDVDKIQIQISLFYVNINTCHGKFKTSWIKNYLKSSHNTVPKMSNLVIYPASITHPLTAFSDTA